jgi:hypothetical protein
VDPHQRIKRKGHSPFYRAIILYNCFRAYFSPAFGRDILGRFEKGISGSLPEAAAGDIVVAACDETYYWRFALSLANSMESLGEQLALHLHILDPSDRTEEHVRELSGKLVNTRLSFTFDRCALAGNLRYRTVYYTVSRFLLAPVLLRRGAARLLIIDVDSLMKNSPWPYLEKLPPDLCAAFIFRHKQKRPWRKVLASAVFYSDSAPSLTWADLFARTAAATLVRAPRYHIDQIIPAYLSKIPGRFDESLRPGQMPAGVMGYNYEPDAAFWTVKGWDAKSGGKFEEVKQRFLQDQD